MNKVKKIKAKIERLKESLPWGSCASQISMECNCKNEAYNEVLSFIDSLSDTEKDFGIKESVIPFGASDSELIEATYFIPQGYHAVIESNKVIIKKGKDPVGENTQFAQMADKYEQQVLIGEYQMKESVAHHCRLSYYLGLKDGAQWQKENLWKDAQGDDLPEIDREVIVLAKALPEHEDSLLKVSFAHRPPKYWMGMSISTGEITRYEPMRYDKGQWSKPAVVWWLDVELPKEEE